MKVIAVVNEKGGTGKTTTSVNLSAALAGGGNRVLLGDLDGQAAASRWMGVEDDPRLADAIINGGGLEPLETSIPNMFLAPGSGKLDSVAHNLRPTQAGQLNKVLTPLQDQFDFVILDCPPSLGNRLIGSALLASSHAIVPVEASVLSLDGLRILLTMLRDIRDGFMHEIELMGAVVCRYNKVTHLSPKILAEVQRALPGRVFSTVIHETVRMQEAPASGKTIFDYAPNCSAAKDYMNLAQEVMQGGPEQTAEATAEVTDALSESSHLSKEERNALADFQTQAAAFLATKSSSVGNAEAETVGGESAAEGEELSGAGLASQEDAPEGGKEATVPEEEHKEEEGKEKEVSYEGSAAIDNGEPEEGSTGKTQKKPYLSAAAIIILLLLCGGLAMWMVMTSGESSGKAERTDTATIQETEKERDSSAKGDSSGMVAEDGESSETVPEKEEGESSDTVAEKDYENVLFDPILFVLQDWQRPEDSLESVEAPNKEEPMSSKEAEKGGGQKVSKDQGEETAETTASARGEETVEDGEGEPPGSEGEAIEAKNYTLNAIMKRGDTRIALINGRQLGVGDQLEKVTIQAIEPRSVTLTNGTDEIVLELAQK